MLGKRRMDAVESIPRESRCRRQHIATILTAIEPVHYCRPGPDHEQLWATSLPEPPAILSRRTGRSPQSSLPTVAISGVARRTVT
jgi:hypothetical protein